MDQQHKNQRTKLTHNKTDIQYNFTDRALLDKTALLL